MGVMSPASGRETAMMDARGSASKTRAVSGTRNDAEAVAARTSGRRSGAGPASPSTSGSGPRSSSGGIRAYRWWPERSVGRRSRFMDGSFEREEDGKLGWARSDRPAKSRDSFFFFRIERMIDRSGALLLRAAGNARSKATFYGFGLFAFVTQFGGHRTLTNSLDFNEIW
jgi:hypothetical protein